MNKTKKKTVTGTDNRSAKIAYCPENEEYKVQFYVGSKKDGTGYFTDDWTDAVDTATAEVNSEIEPVKKTVEIPGPTWETVTKYIKLVIDKHAKKSWHNGARETVFENLDAMAKVAQISVDVAQKLDLENNELLKPEK